MVYVLAFVVLLLAAAVVMLFAMLGELSSRVPVLPAGAAPMDDEARLGHRPDAWPPELAGVAAAPDAVLLVLSTACVSCNRVAEHLRDGFDPLPGQATGIALSTPDPARAERFLREHGLPSESVYVDVGGAWVPAEVGVQTSPSALFFKSGELASATVFPDIESLRTAVKEAV